MKFGYNTPVLVQLSDRQSPGRVIDTSVTTRWDRGLRQHVPHQNMYLVEFWEGAACWYPETDLSGLE